MIFTHSTQNLTQRNILTKKNFFKTQKNSRSTALSSVSLYNVYLCTTGPVQQSPPPGHKAANELGASVDESSQVSYGDAKFVGDHRYTPCSEVCNTSCDHREREG